VSGRLLSFLGHLCSLCLYRLYDQYSFSIIPLLGTIIAGDRDSYQYLVESIRRFPSQPEFSKMIREAGFSTGKDVDGGAWTDLWNGIACIHSGAKI
jgi:2-methoxy-6-polyprenyl-1,4-benzoquinol methylase